MCTVLLPPGDNPITVNKYIKLLVLKKEIATFPCHDPSEANQYSVTMCVQDPL
jgi:hypothetical protein